MKIARAIPFADTARFRTRGSARASAPSNAPLAGGAGGKCLPFVAALAGLLTLSVASGATTPQSQGRADGVTQPATVSPVSLSPSNVTVSDGQARMTGLSGMDPLKSAPLMKTNSVLSATCCLDMPACGVESGSRTARSFSSGKYEPAASETALFNLRSHRPGEPGRRFEFGLGRSHSLDGSVKSGEAPSPRPAQEWADVPLTPSTAPGLASKPGLRLFNWSF